MPNRQKVGNYVNIIDKIKGHRHTKQDIFSFESVVRIAPSCR